MQVHGNALIISRAESLVLSDIAYSQILRLENKRKKPSALPTTSTVIRDMEDEERLRFLNRLWECCKQIP